MFIQDFTVGRPFAREMGESPADYANACKRYEERNAATGRACPREMGESPAEYAQADTFKKSEAAGYATNPQRPACREMGETPAEYAQACKNADAAAPKKGSEMTEQQRVIDFYV